MTSTIQSNISPYKNPLYLTPFELGGINLRPIDLLEHVLATGGTGSGKTRSFVLPLLEKVLVRFGNEHESRAGMILIDAKGDMVKLAEQCVKRAGRSDEVYILGENGNCWFALFECLGGDPTSVADFLFETLEDRGPGAGMSRGSSNESFWEENARRLLRAGVTLAKSRHGMDLGGLPGIALAINDIMAVQTACTVQDDDDFSDKSPDTRHDQMVTEIADGIAKDRILKEEAATLMDYVKHDVCGGNKNTWATISNMTRNYIEQFSKPALQRLFQPDPKRQRITPEDIIDKGILLIVNLSPVIYGEAAAPFRMVIKKLFCEQMLKRGHLCLMEDGEVRPINQARPVLYVCDEFHTTLTARGHSADAFFLDRAREFRCMCVLASQGISAIQSVLGNTDLCDHLLNNCRTKFFFANDCPQTSRYFEYIGGEEDRVVESTTYQPRKAPPRFRLPNYSFSDVPDTVMTTHSMSSQRLPRFSSSELGSLPNGTALVVTKGRRLEKFTLDPANYALHPLTNEREIAEDLV